MRMRTLVPAMLMFAMAGVASAAEPLPEVRAADYAERLWRSSGTPGLSVAVTKNGRIVFSAGFGLADIENRVPATGTSTYDIGSVSKVVTAVAIMQLVEQNKVSLQDPIQKYVPSFPEKAEGRITIWNLMTHTSGIRHYRDSDFKGTDGGENTHSFANFVDTLDIFKNDALLFAPGQYYFYSSYAVNLLQGVVETASGLPFEEYLRRKVWLPSGMLSTSFDIPARIALNRAKSYRITDGQASNYPYADLTYKYASGGMMSTAEDLVRMAVALNEGALLKAGTRAEMFRSQLDPLKRFGETGTQPGPGEREFSQGLLWRIFKDDSGRTFVNHCGSVKAFTTCVVDYPAENVAAVVMANGEPGSPGRKAAVDLAKLFLPTPLP